MYSSLDRVLVGVPGQHGKDGIADKRRKEVGGVGNKVKFKL